MSALLEALFASLLKDENKNLRKKKEKAAAATPRSKSEIETREDDVTKVEDDEEEEIIKVNVDQRYNVYFIQSCDWMFNVYGTLKAQTFNQYFPHRLFMRLHVNTCVFVCV